MKTKCLSLISSFVCLLILHPALHAQAIYAAERSTRIQAGAGLLYLNPDYANETVQGISLWGDYDFRKFLGVEASVHMGSIITPNDIAETSYMIGPRATIHRRKAAVYGKLLFGKATITNQLFNQSSTYNAYAFGGGLEYRLNRKINLRVVDFEMQKWPDFEPHTLSPVSITVGASYSIR